jgi:hypothetical protein
LELAAHSREPSGMAQGKVVCLQKVELQALVSHQAAGGALAPAGQEVMKGWT